MADSSYLARPCVLSISPASNRVPLCPPMAPGRHCLCFPARPAEVPHMARQSPSSLAARAQCPPWPCRAPSVPLPCAQLQQDTDSRMDGRVLSSPATPAPCPALGFELAHSCARRSCRYCTVAVAVELALLFASPFVELIQHSLRRGC
jgi:hypothetical protein